MRKLQDPLRKDAYSFSFAIEVAEAIKKRIAEKPYSSREKVIEDVQNVGKSILKVHPLAFSVENVVRRIVLLINESYDEQESKRSKRARISEITELIQLKMEAQEKGRSENPEAATATLKRAYSVQERKAAVEIEKNLYLEAIDRVIYSLKCFQEEINKYAASHINSNDVIITYGYSHTVEKFLLEAKQQRQFEVIVLETETDNGGGERMAKILASNSIPTSLVPFSAAYAFMSRANKIVIGCHAIMKNGGLLGRAGSLLLVTAAKQYSVPVIIVGSAFKLTPYFPFEQNTFNEILNPKDVLANDKEVKGQPQILAARFDYVQPEYVTLYITNSGEHTPAYIYRLFLNTDQSA